ncbi:MAG TPA: tocopherol cyclase family protein [Firmicutes bacterium]|nr:tocopherol cyclase family protein [Bacillota bacterium]
MHNEFCGWYFKCQSRDETIALIPAVHGSGESRAGSLQFISREENWILPFSGGRCRVEKNRPAARMGESVFSEKGICLRLRTDSVCAAGTVRFRGLTPLRYDIMGPFRCVPFMECRHSVVSMRHRVDGCLQINGNEYRFHNAAGYIEGDRGRSFPRQYAWTQCCFQAGSLMLAVADIPLGPFRFTGVTGAVRLRGKEYRLATYLGAKAAVIRDGTVVVRQGNLSLTAVLLDRSARTLMAPADGSMTRTIRENVACRAFYELREGGRRLFSFETDNASFEFEYP